MTKVFCVGKLRSYELMFEEHGYSTVDTVEDADLVVFCGGEDVSPYFYGQKPIEKTYFNEERDRYEQDIFILAQKMKRPCVGICRGAQFLHVMSGGSLFQDVDNHTRPHYIALKTLTKGFTGNERIYVTSTHHQMMRDDTKTSIVIGVAHEATMKRTDKLIFKGGTWDDLEIVYHPKTRSLCYQPHPEMSTKTSANRKLFFNLLNQYFGI